MANYFTEAEAAKISFDAAPTKTTTTIAAKPGDKSTASSAVAKIKKPKRTPEEAIKDQEDLKLALDYSTNKYQEAALVYQNLDLFIDLQPMDAYRYGVCLFNTKKDKTNCILALESCVNDKTVPIDVYYFLAKANHASYRFNTAINYYKKYMAVCKPEDIKSLKIEEEIVHCRSGIKLVNNPVVLKMYQ